jgi:hypothetical protein
LTVFDPLRTSSTTSPGEVVGGIENSSKIAERTKLIQHPKDFTKILTLHEVKRPRHFPEDHKSDPLEDTLIPKQVTAAVSHRALLWKAEVGL